jgi:hypothetical protein
MTTKGELRAARKAARAAGQAWHVEHEDGRPVMVRERTAREERAHERRMYRLARLAYDHDRDF